MIRLFVALIIPEEIKKRIVLVRKQVYPAADNLKWEEDSQIHLTLKFIGEVKEDLVEAIKHELNFLENLTSIDCTVSKFGFFFNEKNEPRILWLGLKMDESVYTIVDELNQRLFKFSIPVEKRKFKAHLTLMRVKEKVTTDFIEKFSSAEFPKIDFAANEIVLMQSTLSPQGSTYKEVKKYILK
jgi:2'-5' RNA ligase